MKEICVSFNSFTNENKIFHQKKKIYIICNKEFIIISMKLSLFFIIIFNEISGNAYFPRYNFLTAFCSHKYIVEIEIFSFSFLIVLENFGIQKKATNFNKQLFYSKPFSLLSSVNFSKSIILKFSDVNADALKTKALFF